MKSTHQLLSALACAFDNMSRAGKFKKKNIHYNVYLTPFTRGTVLKVLEAIGRISQGNTDFQLITHWSKEYGKCSSQEQKDIVESLNRYLAINECLHYSYLTLTQVGIEAGMQLYKDYLPVFEKTAHVIESFSGVEQMGIDLMYITRE